MRIPALGSAMAASNAGDEECGGLGARETADSSVVDPQWSRLLYSGWRPVEPGARCRDQVQPAPAPAPLGKAKPSELLRLRRKSWPSAQLQERSHLHCTEVSGAILLKTRRKVNDQLMIIDWWVVVGQKRESLERKRPFLPRRLSGHLIVVSGNKLYSELFGPLLSV